MEVRAVDVQATDPVVRQRKSLAGRQLTLHGRGRRLSPSEHRTWRRDVMISISRSLLSLPLLVFALACSDAPEGSSASDAAATTDAPKPAETVDSQPGATVLAPMELAARLEAGTAPVLLDVRSPEEFAAGHIPGAINIPYDEIPARLAEIAWAR